MLLVCLQEMFLLVRSVFGNKNTSILMLLLLVNNVIAPYKELMNYFNQIIKSKGCSHDAGPLYSLINYEQKLDLNWVNSCLGIMKVCCSIFLNPIFITFCLLLSIQSCLCCQVLCNHLIYWCAFGGVTFGLILPTPLSTYSFNKK